MSSNSTKIREHIVHFYKQLYSEQYNWQPKLDSLSFMSTNAKERNWLERDVKESEVLEVVREFNGDRAPGLGDLLWLFSKSVGRY
jgi:hypothetical protein